MGTAVERLGPITLAPRDLLRPDVLLCLGEDAGEWQMALADAGFRTQEAHTYRGFRFRAGRGLVCILGPFGTSAVEGVLWEILPPREVRRLVLVGTAGSLPACTAEALAPCLLDPVHAGPGALEAPPEATWSPTMALDLPRHRAVSTDLFHGFSPHALAAYPAGPALQEAWARWAGEDALVEMEAAPFYAMCDRFAPDGTLEYAAVKAPANPASDLDSLPEMSSEALAASVEAALEGMGHGP